LLWKKCGVTELHKALVCFILLCYKVWQVTVENMTQANGRILWTYVLDPAPSMKENRGWDKEMREPASGGCDFSLRYL
jgi:hypothetical protein